MSEIKIGDIIEWGHGNPWRGIVRAKSQDGLLLYVLVTFPSKRKAVFETVGAGNARKVRRSTLKE